MGKLYMYCSEKGVTGITVAI